MNHVAGHTSLVWNLFIAQDHLAWALPPTAPNVFLRDTAKPSNVRAIERRHVHGRYGRAPPVLGEGIIERDLLNAAGREADGGTKNVARLRSRSRT